MKRSKITVLITMLLAAALGASFIASCASGSQSSSAAAPADMEAALQNDTWFNLQNFHFLDWFYEADGILVYGETDLDNDKALWSFTKAARRKGLWEVYAVRNKASGNFLMPIRGSDKIAVTKADDPFVWSWEIGRYGIVFGNYEANRLQDPSDDRIVCIHMEGRKGYAELSTLNKTWGTPNWLLHEHGDPRYWAVKSENTGLYLYDDGNNTLRLGNASEMDGRYYWLYENVNNIISIKNRRTGRTISVQEIYNEGMPNLNLPVRVINSLQHWQTNRWVLAPAGREGVFSIESSFQDLANFRLYNKGSGDDKVYLSDSIPSNSQSAQWRQEEIFIDLSVFTVPSGYIRLMNSGRGDCLFESPEARTVLFGRSEAADPRSHWQIVRDGREPDFYRLRNRHTGYDAAADGNRIQTVQQGSGGDAALWQLSNAAGNENILFRSKTNSTLLLNIDRSGEKGYAELSAESSSAGHTQWMAERAAELGPVPATLPIIPSLGRATPMEQLRTIPERTTIIAADALKRGNDLYFSVFAPAPGAYPVTFDFAGAGDVFVNGIRAGSLASSMELNFNPGINIVSVRGRAHRLASVTFSGGAGRAVRGAAVLWTSLEAEDMNTNAEVMRENRAYREFMSEASGRRAVRLTRTGDYVEFTASREFNSIVLRYCIPDAPDGGGIEATLGMYVNGRRVRDLALNSKYSWVYGMYPWSNTPDNLPHRFFDDSRFLLDSAFQAGTVIRFQKDAGDTADYYIIDMADIEMTAPPLERPGSSVSLTDYGAVPNDGRDDTAAFIQAMNAASRAKKDLYIPPGEFNFNGARSISVNRKDMTIRGAGVWHTILRGSGAGFMVTAANVSFSDFSLIGEETARDDALGRAGFETPYSGRNSNLTIQNIWMEHLKVGVWVHRNDAILVSGCRIRNGFADGINLVGGTINSIVEQNHIRNMGDDSIALWSSANLRRNNANNRIRFNSAGLQWLANNAAVYGGRDNQITDNIFFDTVVNGTGVTVNTDHNPVDFEGIVTVSRNTFLRCGSNQVNFNQDLPAVWILPLRDMNIRINITDNEILNSTNQAFYIHGALGPRTVREINFENNYIETCGTWAVDIGGGVSGGFTRKNNTVSGSMIGQWLNKAGADFIVYGD